MCFFLKNLIKKNQIFFEKCNIYFQIRLIFNDVIKKEFHFKNFLKNPKKSLYLLKKKNLYLKKYFYIFVFLNLLFFLKKIHFHF